MPGPVERWLETFMCKQYADTFEAYGFKTLQSVCQLQEQQLQAMGVAQEHCNQILENVHVLRQSLGGNVSHFQSDLYSNHGNSIPLHLGYPNQCSSQHGQNMIGMHSGNIGYAHGFPGQQQRNIPSQEQYSMHEHFYPSQSPSQAMYMGFSGNGSGQFLPNHYGLNARRGSTRQMQYDQVSSNTGCPSGMVGPMNQSPQQQHSNNGYSRRSNQNQNPQEVANNILQMAATNYQPSQTVHIPLSKSNRPAPYHVPPKSPHSYNVHPPSKQYPMSSPPFAYPNSASHIPPQMTRSSPVSPMYNMHSPASQHSCQSLPNSSPRSMHSPSHSTSSSGCKRSPSAIASPIGEMNSLMQMQSPSNFGSSQSISAPLNQQLHVSVSNSHHSSIAYTGDTVSPQHGKLPNRYSPKTNPISPPVHRSLSRSSSVHSSHSTDHFSSPPETKYLNDTGCDSNNDPPPKNGKNPLTSLEQLCMLPEKQVVDPKSVVNETCLDCNSSSQNQKNSDSGVDLSHKENIPKKNQESESTSRKDVENPGDEVPSSMLDAPIGLVDTSEISVQTNKNEDNNLKEENKSVVEKSEGNALLKEKNEQNCSDGKLTCVKVEKEFMPGVIQENLQSENSTGKEVAEVQAKVQVKDSESLIDTCHSDAVQELTSTDLFIDQNCNVEQCKNSAVRINGLVSSSDKTTTEFVKKSKEHDNCKFLDGILNVEKVPKENNNEFLKGLNGDKNSCIQYYKPKSIKKSKRALSNPVKPKYTYDKSIRSKILSNVKEFSLSSDEAVPRNESLSEKMLLRRAQIRRNRSVHAVSARITSSGTIERMTYSESDSDDDGVLMVRKDNHCTYDRSSRVLTELRRPVADGITSQEGDVSSENESSSNINSFCEKEKENVKEGIGNEAGLDSASKNSSEVISHGEGEKSSKRMRSVEKESSSIKKTSQGALKNFKDKTLKSRSMKNSGNYEKAGTKKRQTDSKHVSHKTSNDVMDQDEIDGVSFKTSGAKGENSSAKTSASSSAAPTSSNSSKRTSRRRNRTSPAKYGDLYYGGDYVIDSDDEIEIEKLTKRPKKTKVQEVEEEEEPETIVIDESDSDDDDDYVPNKAEIEEFDSVHETLSPQKELNAYKQEEAKLISSKSEKLKKEADKKVKHSRGKQKRKQSDINSSRPRGGKSSKIRKLWKFEHAVEKFKYDHESVQNMKLKKTLDLMKQKDKKVVKDNSAEAKSVGPFIRLTKSKVSPTSCHVINVLDSDQPSDCKKVMKKTTSVSVSTVHMSKVPSEKSILVPNSTVLDESNWVCALCQKHSSYKFLGDLFGPYYLDGNLPSSKDLDSLGNNSCDTKSKRRKSEENIGCGSANGHKMKSRRKSATVTKPPMEVWVHEDCVAWADGVLLIGSKIYGLEEAVSIAASTVCSICDETGATVGCLHKGCSQKFHVTCAVEADCFMDEENFSLLCQKHKSRILKKSENMDLKS